MELQTKSAPDQGLGQILLQLKEKCKKAANPHTFLFLYTVFSIVLKSVVIIAIINKTHYVFASWIDMAYVVPTYLVYFAFIFILLSFSFLLSGKKRLWYFLSFIVVFSTLLLFDLWYFRAFGTFISVHVVRQYANLQNLTGSIMSMGSLPDVLLFLDIPFLIYWCLKRKDLYCLAKRSIPACLGLIVFSITYLSYAHYVFDLSDQRGQKQFLFEICWTPIQTVTDLSPMGYHLFDAYNYFTDCQQLVLTDTDQQEIDKWYQDKQEKLPDTVYKGMFKGKNLLVIQVESLETFYLKNELDGQEITPVLNRLLRHSIYFPDFYEQVNVGTTSDAEFMANTSVYPVRMGSTYYRYPDNTYNSLPKLFDHLGYSVMAAHPDNRGYWNWMHAMQSIGYDYCIDSNYFKIDEVIGLGLSDGSFLQQLVPYIKEQQQPFFTFMITMTNHGPFELPDKYKTLKVDKKFEGTKMGASFHTVRYTDEQIGKFLDKLDEEGLLDNTVVVIYGDHNGVHKFYNEEIPKIQPPEDWWLTNNHRVPFLIYQKNLQGEEVWTKGGHIDILPTIAYLMGVEEKAYSHTAMGRNLLKTNKDFAVLVDGQFVGQAADSQEEEHAVHGLELADKMIRSSYFGKR